MVEEIFKLFVRKLFYIHNRKKFSHLAINAVLDKLLRIDGKENIIIRKNVVIQKSTWIAAVPLTNKNTCSLIVDEGCIIGNFNHIYATEFIHIEKNVLTADKVYIADNSHSFDNIDIPIMHQGIRQLPKVKIGEGSWIGENVCIIGASVGRNSVIGANSVVTKDIPDYCVAVGSPARVVKKYNFMTKKWEKV